MPNIPTRQIEGSLDRSRTGPLPGDEEKHNRRAVLPAGRPTLGGLGTAQLAVEREALGHTVLHSQDSGVSLLEACLSYSQISQLLGNQSLVLDLP